MGHPNNRPYRSLAAADDDDGGGNDDRDASRHDRLDGYCDAEEDDRRIIATQSIDLEVDHDSDHRAGRRSAGCKSLAVAAGCCLLLIGAAYGGNEYYRRNRAAVSDRGGVGNGGNDGAASGPLFSSRGKARVRGSSSDGGGGGSNLGDDSDPHEEELAAEEDSEGGEEIEGEDSEDESRPKASNGARPPDYFVPLTPAERAAMKERLRDTLRETKAALLFGGGGDDVDSPPVGGALPNNPRRPQRTLVLDADAPKQFMHMHHMKTGGTSVDGLIKCALNRQSALREDEKRIDYNSMSECGSRVRTCMNDLAGELNATVVNNVFYRNANATVGGAAEQNRGFDPADESLEGVIEGANVCRTSSSSVMSYCASLHAVRTFGWKDVDKVTVIRDPVDRAWSMYKFSLSRCYKCLPMKDVLRRVENGTFFKGWDRDAEGGGRDENDDGEDAGGAEEEEEQNYVYDPNDTCAIQMIGHQATNLLSSVELYNVANDVRFPREREIVDEAVRNLREEFTWIGVTDRLEESVDGMRAVFPFLAENLNEAAAGIRDVLERSGEELTGNGMFSLLPESYEDEEGCKLEHRNGGREPKCGTTELDEETIQLIEKLTARDAAVYKAAVERFGIQQEVLEEYWNGSL